MAVGVTDRLWDVADLVALWESYEQRRAERAAWVAILATVGLGQYYRVQPILRRPHMLPAIRLQLRASPLSSLG